MGDPHCVNVRGEAFDLFKTGDAEMAIVPKTAHTRGRDLRVIANIQPIAAAKCAPMVIMRVDVYGEWLGAIPPLSIVPGADGQPAIPEEWRDVAVPENLTMRVTPSTHRVELQIAKDVRVLAVQRRGYKTGIEYLDLKVMGLKTLGRTAGGLLGLDSHTHEARPPTGCDPHAIVKLRRGHRHGRHRPALGFAEDEEEGPEGEMTGRMISVASAMDEE